MFQHTAARRRLAMKTYAIKENKRFQHTAARRRLVYDDSCQLSYLSVSTHSRPKAAGIVICDKNGDERVSTHSRPKAAGAPAKGRALTKVMGFNTQPPEGGWTIILQPLAYLCMFQHTAARRRLVSGIPKGAIQINVSTHSRPKAAGVAMANFLIPFEVSTHSRPKAAGMTTLPERILSGVSTHSRPKAAGRLISWL